MSDLIKLTGLWMNKKDDGGWYASGSLGNAKVLIFPNTHKKPNSNEPDWEMFLAPRKRQAPAAKERQGQASRNRRYQEPAYQSQGQGMYQEPPF